MLLLIFSFYQKFTSIENRLRFCDYLQYHQNQWKPIKSINWAIFAYINYVHKEIILRHAYIQKYFINSFKKSNECYSSKYSTSSKITIRIPTILKPNRLIHILFKLLEVRNTPNYLCSILKHKDGFDRNEIGNKVFDCFNDDHVRWILARNFYLTKRLKSHDLIFEQRFWTVLRVKEFVTIFDIEFTNFCTI